MTPWLAPDVAVSVLIYACAFVAPVAVIAAVLQALRAYAPPPHGRVLSSRQLVDGRWLLKVRWHSRHYIVVGEQHAWHHRRSGKACKSRPMKAWLCLQWAELERLPMTVEAEQIEADDVEAITGASESVIRMAGGA